MFSIKRLFRSFRYAAKGFLTVLREEQSFQIQLIIGIFIIALIFFFKVKVWETVALLLMVTMVLVLELINSIFERIVDVLKPRLNIYIEEIKDIMAATVLLSSVVSAIVGIIIFWPYVKDLILCPI